MPTALPKQIGYLTHGTTQQSSLILGKDITVTFEAFGFGPQGRPDVLEQAVINLTYYNNNTQTKVGTLSISASDLNTIMQNNSNAKNIKLTLQELDYCQNNQAMKIIVLASQPYNTA